MGGRLSVDHLCGVGRRLAQQEPPLQSRHGCSTESRKLADTGNVEKGLLSAIVAQMFHGMIVQGKARRIRGLTSHGSPETLEAVVWDDFSMVLNEDVHQEAQSGYWTLSVDPCRFQLE